MKKSAAIIGLAAALALPVYSGAATQTTQQYSSVWGDFNKDNQIDYFFTDGNGGAWYVESDDTGYMWKKLSEPTSADVERARSFPQLSSNIIAVEENDSGYHVHVKNLEGKVLTYEASPSKLKK